MRTGILGGTFDPIHLAHLHAAETALAGAQLDRILFVPAGDPWQKADRDVTGANHRVAMVALAIADAPGFELDTREVDRPGPTYTIDTLNSFQDDEDLYLILGADAAGGVDSWHQANAVVERARFLVLPRPGTDTNSVASNLPGARVLQMAALDISSTTIRAMAREGKPFRYLVPARVHEYIQVNRLYVGSQ
ncbi:MAG TPA: nicotinate-nucleotide adenylyltransferase [Acidimicrobiia bacterium]